MVEATINVDGDAEKLNVTKDRIVSVTNFASALSCLEGTEVAFSTADGYAIKAIDMNGTAVTAETDGSYKVVVNSNSTINVKVAVASGIGSVTTSAQKGADVYTIAGVLVLKNATPSQINALAKGLYIINGKTVVR